MHLTVREALDNHIFALKPYEHTYSRQFIKAVKCDDRMLIIELLKQFKYLIYQFDYTYKSGLHWATIL